MVMFDELDYGPCHDRQADDIGISDSVHVLLVQPWYGPVPLFSLSVNGLHVNSCSY